MVDHERQTSGLCGLAASRPSNVVDRARRRGYTPYMAHAYDPPRIEDRTELDAPLIGAVASGNTDSATSAAFRPL